MIFVLLKPNSLIITIDGRLVVHITQNTLNKRNKYIENERVIALLM